MELMMRDNNIGRRRKRACESCVLQNAGNVLPRVSTASTSASKYLLFLIMLIPPKIKYYSVKLLHSFLL